MQVVAVEVPKMLLGLVLRAALAVTVAAEQVL
jgi:hypothetical protein